MQGRQRCDAPPLQRAATTYSSHEERCSEYAVRRAWLNALDSISFAFKVDLVRVAVKNPRTARDLFIQINGGLYIRTFFLLSSWFVVNNTRGVGILSMLSRLLLGKQHHTCRRSCNVITDTHIIGITC